jgi:hypothetical protein
MKLFDRRIDELQIGGEGAYQQNRIILGLSPLAAP